MSEIQNKFVTIHLEEYCKMVLGEKKTAKLMKAAKEKDKTIIISGGYPEQRATIAAALIENGNKVMMGDECVSIQIIGGERGISYNG